MTKSILIHLLMLAALFLAPAQAEAHPHVYVDAAVTFEVTDQGITAMRENWLFDEIFSQAILADLELTPGTLAAPMGQDIIKNGAFAYLANYDYFTFLENNGKRLSIQPPQNFRASWSEGRLVYDFTIPIDLPIQSMKKFRAAVFDKEYYSDILLLEDRIQFEIDGMVQVSHTVRPAKDQKYWQFIIPKAIHISITPSGGNMDTSGLETATASDQEGLLTRLMEHVRSTQKYLTLKLNGFGMDIKADPFGSSLWLFLAFSLLYGIVHAVGPGHGKAVVCSYFLSHPGSLTSGFIMGNTITFVHMGSAAVAVGLAYLVFSTGMGGFAEASRALQPASYALLALMGLGLTAKAIYDLIQRKAVVAGCETSDEVDTTQLKKILTVSFVTGLVPCPGAAVILAFAIGQNILWAGMAALFAMAVGMGLTTTLFAWGALAARKATLTASGVNPTLLRFMRGGLSLCGGVAIMLFGAVLFMSSTGWH